MGVQLFIGKFYHCIDPVTKEQASAKIVPNKHACEEKNYTWTNPDINFDHVPNAYLALFQVVSF